MNVQEMRARDNHECLSCGSTTLLTTQHRLNRKMGGRSGAAAAASEAPSNRCTLCLWCNERLERDPRFAEKGRRCGWKLLEHEDPTSVAVYHSGFREWRLLDDEGGYTVVPDRDAPALEWAA